MGLFSNKTKQPKVKPLKEYPQVMADFFEASDLDCQLPHYRRIEYVAFSLGFLTEYLNVHFAKKKEIPDVQHRFLTDIWGFSATESQQLEKEIISSTSHHHPMIQLLVIEGIETYDQFINQTDADFLRQKKEQMDQLIASQDDKATEDQ